MLCFLKFIVNVLFGLKGFVGTKRDSFVSQIIIKQDSLITLNYF